MADEPEVASTSSSKESADQAKALDSLTDSVPERQVDGSKVQKAMAELAAAARAEKEAQLKREKELAGVKINREDVDVVAHEFEVDKKTAESKLRENGGDLYKTLKTLL